MSTIPYSLNSKVKKGRCPACGHKGKFVYYVNNETLEKIGDRYGRCDRIESCRYHFVPNRDSVSIDENFVPLPQKPISNYSFDLVSRSMRLHHKNNFIKSLYTVFKEEDILKAIENYLIGTSFKKWYGATIFWQIDITGKVMFGKVMKFELNGHRAKNENGDGLVTSIRVLSKMWNYRDKQCLFGLHQVMENNNKTIAIVESEKTAVIMSIIMPQYTWLATGSLQGFKYEFLQPIKGRNIFAYPDKGGAYNNWCETRTELNRFGFNIKVDDILENIDLPDGSDLADVFFHGKNEIEQHIKKPKVIKLLTENEKIANRFGEINPAFNTLVNTFELTINK